MLLERLIGTESKASPQFFSQLCPGPGSQALLWPVDTPADGHACCCAALLLWPLLA